jgi:hypothetical protein
MVGDAHQSNLPGVHFDANNTHSVLRRTVSTVKKSIATMPAA